MGAGVLVSLASAALRAHGITDPSAHLFLAGTSGLATIIVSNAPLSPVDLATLHAATTNLEFTALLSPDREAASPVLRQVVQASNAKDIVALSHRHHMDLTPPTDDRPFFFNQLLLSELGSVLGAREDQTISR